MDKYNKGQCNDKNQKDCEMGQVKNQGQWKDKDNCSTKVQGKGQRKNPVQGKEPCNPGQFNDPCSKPGKPSGFKK